MADKFDKFTERARRVLTLAQEEAQRFNHNYIGTEHLLLGLVREGDGVAARVLYNLDVKLPTVRSSVEFIIGRGESMIMGEIGLTPRAKKVIELAVDEAPRLNHHYIGTEHLLLGVIREGAGLAAGVLESLGVSLGEARAQVMQVISGGGSYRQGSEQVPPVVIPGGPSPFPGPTLRQLVRVIPIGQTQGQRGIEVLALALEAYADGFVVTLQLQAAGGASFARGTPDLPLEATDDRGGRYVGRAYGGSGGGGRDYWQWRLARAFTPALDPAARELRLEAAVLHWLRPDETRRRVFQGAGTLRPVPAERVPGPWTFTVALPPGDAPEDRPQV